MMILIFRILLHHRTVFLRESINSETTVEGSTTGAHNFAQQLGGTKASKNKT